MTDAVVVGIGETPLGRLPGQSAMMLQAAAARLALADAGLAPADVDGVLSGTVRTEPRLMPSLALAEYLGIRPRFCTTDVMGGASAAQMVTLAAMAVATGSAEVVLCVHGENRASGMTRDEAVAALSKVGHPELETPFGPTIPSYYALIAQRHMHEHGTTRADLAAVAVTMREHAARHPGAYLREPLTIEQVLASKPIAEPLHLLDCCPIADGAGAVIVTSAARAARTGQRAVKLLGWGEAHGHEHLVAAASLTESAAVESGRAAYERAAVGPADVDAAMLYDCFTITVLVELEDLGFVPRGESGAFAARGAMRLGGELPVNTHGGLLSHGQPGSAGGMFHLIEAARQLRGSAGARQVENARIVLVHGNAGTMCSHVTLILGKESA
jgi:acetyl-CoA acetyltransferase